MLTKIGYGNWTGHFEGVEVGTHYGFRVHGKWDPENGYFFNPAKLLIDPYAKSVSGKYNYCEAVFPYEARLDTATKKYTPVLLDGKLQISTLDSAPHVPHSVVVSESEEVEEVDHPCVKWRNTLIYEAHVVGLTKFCPFIPEELRGTYLGVSHPEMIKYLKDLGVTTIELLPIHSKISEEHLLQKNLENYWGYSNLSYFAPEPSYATISAQQAGGDAVISEVKQMVKELHEGGIEVLLDVVYNHTCEESSVGPELCYRGIANRQYYVHQDDNPGQLIDTTGCGNSLNFRSSKVIGMALNSLRYWANVIGVDGFRFDLMVTCARGEYGFSREHPFLVGIRTDPVLSNLKMIAEPWDLGIEGWRTGGFGFPFAEWNDSFRNDMRNFWINDWRRIKQNYSISSATAVATRLSGSYDVFHSQNQDNERGHLRSVNYITAHDGFTLNDLVSYDSKHNEANMEDNRDGTVDNLSYNHGVEGETKQSEINQDRRRTMRNLLGCLLLSTGIPMLVAGDEMGNTQKGNNNAYCQNNEISYLNWNLKPWQKNLQETVRHLNWIKRTFPALCQNSFFKGLSQALIRKNPEFPDDIDDLSWWKVDGNTFEDDDWKNSVVRSFQALFSGPYNGMENSHRDVLFVVNASNSVINFQLPAVRKWERLWNSRDATPKDFKQMQSVDVSPFSLQVFASIK
jgi:glycogen operon protein